MHTAQRPSMRCRDERGSAMMAVLGLMAVTIVIGLTITAATINGLGVTSSNKASVQSRAAAEAGIDSALLAASAAAAAGGCPAASISSTDVPAYVATIEYLTIPPPPVAPVAVLCSNPAAAQVRIVSTGKAESTGLSGAASGDESKVEAVYGYTQAVPAVAAVPATPDTPAIPGTPGTPGIPAGIVASGAAMYLYGGMDFKNNSPIATTGAAAGIQVKSGNLDCDNNTNIKGNVVVENGSLSLKKCDISGNVWASGTATMQNSTITGNLNAANASKPSTVTGNYNKPPAASAVPDWVDFGYEPGKWLNSDGSAFTVKNLAGCNLTTASTVNTTASTKPLILNALGCSAGITGSESIALANDLVIFAHGFDFTGMANGLTFGSATPHKLWFITPDGNTAVVADKKPTCAGQGDFQVKNGFTIASTVSAMLYTPCSIAAKNRPTWSGQVYVGAISSSWNDIDFDYAGVGLPGVNLSDGTVTAGPTAAIPATGGTAVIPGKAEVKAEPAKLATVDALTSHRDLAG